MKGLLIKITIRALLFLFIGINGGMQGYPFCPHHAFTGSVVYPDQDTLENSLEYGNILGIIFRIQIISSSHPIYQTPENFNGMENVDEYYEEGNYSYLVGYSEDYGYARDVLLNQIRQRGFIQAEVLAFRSSERILLEEALRMIEESREKGKKKNKE